MITDFKYKQHSLPLDWFHDKPVPRVFQNKYPKPNQGLGALRYHAFWESLEWRIIFNLITYGDSLITTYRKQFINLHMQQLQLWAILKCVLRKKGELIARQVLWPQSLISRCYGKIGWRVFCSDSLERHTCSSQEKTCEQKCWGQVPTTTLPNNPRLPFLQSTLRKLSELKTYTWYICTYI